MFAFEDKLWVEEGVFGHHSPVDYTQQVAIQCDSCFHLSQLFVFVILQIVRCSCVSDSLQLVGQQSLVAILHLRPHFTAAFHLLPMFTMFGPTLHVVLHSGVKQGVS